MRRSPRESEPPAPVTWAAPGVSARYRRAAREGATGGRGLAPVRQTPKFSLSLLPESAFGQNLGHAAIRPRRSDLGVNN